MPDLVDLVRAELTRAASEVEASPTLDARVHAHLAARNRRRRMATVAAAAAVVALVLAVPALASGGPDAAEQPGVVTDEGTSPPLHLVPDPLPPGFALDEAMGDGRLDASAPPGRGAATGAGGTTTRWGTFDDDGALTEVLTVYWGVDLPEAGDPGPGGPASGDAAGGAGGAGGAERGDDAAGAVEQGDDAGAEVEVRGVTGRFEPQTGLLVWTEADGTMAMLDGGPLLSADGTPTHAPMDAETAVAIAEGLEALPSGEVAAPGLAPNWEPLGSWPTGGAAGTGPRDARWSGPAGAEVHLHLVTGAEVPPAAGLVVAGAHREAVRGREAVVAPTVRDLPTVDGGMGVVTGADVTITWEDARDTQVTLSARGVAEADLLAFADTLRPASAEEWRALVESTSADADGPRASGEDGAGAGADLGADGDAGGPGAPGGAPDGSGTTAAPDDVVGPPGPDGSPPPLPPPPTLGPEAASAPVQVAGTFTGHERYRIGTAECPDLTHDLDATYTLDDGTAWELHVDYCGHHEGDTWFGEGPFTFTLPGGDTITGTMDNTAPYGSAGVPYELVVTGGTGAYAGATGMCAVDNRLSGRQLGSQDHSGSFACGITPGAGS